MKKILEDKSDIDHLNLGDIHVGGLGAIFPPNAKEYNGDPKPQIKLQKWIYKNYIEDLTKVGKVDVITDFGDNTDGQELKISGRTLVSTDTDNQVIWATECLQKAIDICKPSYFISLDGTPYHVSTGGGSCDFQVHNSLKKDNPDIEFIYEQTLVIKIGELIYSLAHPYPTTDQKIPPLEKLIHQHAADFYLDNTPRIDVFGRGHAHFYSWLSYRGGAYAYVVPCQQVYSDFAKRKFYLGVRHPDVGVLKIHQEEKLLMPQVYLHKWRE